MTQNLAVGQPLRRQRRRGGPDRQHLGVCGRVVEFARAVAGSRDDLAPQHDRRADRHLSPRASLVRLGEGRLHVTAKGHAPVIAPMPGLAKHRRNGHGLRHSADGNRKAAMTEGERIAKVLARAGVASRREAERVIAAGRVSVNGRTIDSPALNVTAKDRITVDGKPLAEPEPPRLWLYHKPTGLVTTERDEKGRPTVFQNLPEDLPRVMSVGRLDLNSEGLLLLTNDGEIKRRLELPATGWSRKYRVRIHGTPSDATFEPLRKGVTVEGERFRPMTVTLDRQQGANAWATISLREGRNREIRRAMEAIGLSVTRLIRVGYGPFRLGELKPGEVSEVKPRVVRDQLGLSELPLPKSRKR